MDFLCTLWGRVKLTPSKIVKNDDNKLRPTSKLDNIKGFPKYQEKNVTMNIY